MSAVTHDLTGQRFGKLVAAEHQPGRRGAPAKWACRCDCGGSVSVHQYSLRHGITRSCGCLKSEIPAPNKADLVGQIFGRLTVVAADGRTNAKQTRWHCRCECGGEALTTTGKLRGGHTTSCGCFKREATAFRFRKDGLFTGGERHPLFDTYNKMIGRCYNQNDAAYEAYGGRGITVCDRWRFGVGGKTGLAIFIKEMGPRPSSRHSLDREDNDGNYDQSNCRWATKKQQARNRRSNHLVDCDGQAVALSEFCERKGLRFQIINQRIGRGWSLDRAISQPPRGGAVLSC